MRALGAARGAIVRTRTIVALALVVRGALAGAQGTVQERDPRRPPPPEDAPGCELWRGRGSGNDPSAEAWVQLCGRDTHVTGVFLWSSLTSGWDRRSLEGDWSPDRARLVMRDTRMLESHPREGWQLCAADRYELRRVSATRLEGGYDSSACSDHGTLSLELVTPGSAPPRTPSLAPAPAPPGPPVRARGPRSGGLARLGWGCTASPRERVGTTSAWWLAPWLALGLLRKRARREGERGTTPGER